MRIVIDGYNLIRLIPELRVLDREDLETGRDGLVRELSSYRAARGHRITVVFDGAGSIHLGGGTVRLAGITVRYSPRGRSADSVIRQMCREGLADVVVSGDREITDVAKKAGVTAVSPERFWDRVMEAAYRRLKGEDEPEEDPSTGRRAGKGGRGEKGRKLSKDQRRDRGRIDKL